MYMANHAYLAANHTILTYFGAAGYPRLGRNYRIRAYIHVMGHLDQVVQLYPWRITVEPMVARSIVVLAPISTSSCITTLPIWGTFL